MLETSPYPVPGLQEAIALYGTPQERHYTYQVRRETFLYWQLVRRKRMGEVAILLRRRNGRYLVQSKGFYPSGTYRLMTGGIKPGEHLSVAVEREALEETGLIVRIERFWAILTYDFLWESQRQSFTSYLFEVAEQDGVLAPGDPDEAISDYREITLAEMASLAEHLEALPPEWSDWGHFRAAVHRFIAESVEHHDK